MEKGQGGARREARDDFLNCQDDGFGIRLQAEHMLCWCGGMVVVCCVS